MITPAPRTTPHYGIHMHGGGDADGEARGMVTDERARKAKKARCKCAVAYRDVAGLAVLVVAGRHRAVPAAATHAQQWTPQGAQGSRHVNSTTIPTAAWRRHGDGRLLRLLLAACRVRSLRGRHDLCSATTFQAVCSQRCRERRQRGGRRRVWCNADGGAAVGVEVGVGGGRIPGHGGRTCTANGWRSRAAQQPGAQHSKQQQQRATPPLFPAAHFLVWVRQAVGGARSAFEISEPLLLSAHRSDRCHTSAPARRGVYAAARLAKGACRPPQSLRTRILRAQTPPLPLPSPSPMGGVYQHAKCLHFCAV